MEQNNPNPILPILAGAAIGVLAADIWQNHVDAEYRKSRAEIEDPDAVEDVFEALEKVENRIRLDTSMTDENRYRRAMALQLRFMTKLDIEEEPYQYGMKPDILLDGLVAIELKLNPCKTELDRLIGQLAGYAREWATIICLINTPKSTVRRLRELLEDSGLDHLEIWEY